MSIKRIPRLTDEEKAKFGPMLQQVWEQIAPDAVAAKGGGSYTVRDIVEMTCDAHRPMEYGGMTREEYDRFCDCYHHNNTQRWLRKILNY